MQVTQYQDYDTHAILGGKNQTKMKIAQTPEFFQVLSTTLYSRPLEAVVRESLCNAYDAHISVKSDKPIEITLTNLELIIRDHGPGIAPDMIEPLYLTYGGTTKVGDETQIGGFGLGCKAPFSMSDHFTVASMYEGTKTVYVLSKGSEASQGMPYSSEMVSAPTTETGVELRIPVKDRTQYEQLEKLITTLVYWGQFNVVFNGNPLETVPVSPDGITLWNGDTQPTSSGYFFIRYGHILYPIEDTDNVDIAVLIGMRSLSPSRSYKVILDAPPNSISVVPSREHLNYNAQTLNTLGVLLKHASERAAFEEKQARTLLTATHKESLELVECMSQKEQIDLALSIRAGKEDLRVFIPALAAGAESPVALTPSERAKLYFRGFSRYTILESIKSRIVKYLKKKYKRQTPLLDVPTKKGIKWVKTRLVRQGLKLENIKSVWHGRASDEGRLGEMDLHRSLLSTPFVVVTHSSRIMLPLQDKLHPLLQHVRSFLIYVHPNRKELGEVTEKLKKAGFIAAVNFNDIYEPILAAKRKEYVPAAPKPKQEGLPLLETIRQTENVWETSRQIRSSDYKLVAVPFRTSDYLKPYVVLDSRYVKSKHLLDLYPGQIGLCRSGKQLESQVKQGAIPLVQQLLTDLQEVLANIPRFVEWKFFHENQGSRLGNLVSSSQEDPAWGAYKSILAPMIPKPFTDREKVLFPLFESVRQGTGRYRPLNFPKELAPIHWQMSEIAKNLPDPPQGPVSKRLNSLLQGVANQEILTLRGNLATEENPSTFTLRQIALLDGYLLNEIGRIINP